VQLWLVVLGCGATLGLLALFAALRIEFDARGVGEPSGAWVFAFGLGFGLAAVSGMCGKGVPLVVELHVLGRRFPLRWRGRKKREEPTKNPEDAPVRPSLGARVQRWLDSPPSLEPLRLAGRRVSLDELSLDTTYGFRDIALTGRVAGVLYALSGVLPDYVHLNQRPRWDGSERWELSLSGRVAVYPTLVLLELLWYMLRARLGRTVSKSVGAPPAQPPLENLS
jgi:hypothetical protein